MAFPEIPGAAAPVVPQGAAAAVHAVPVQPVPAAPNGNPHNVAIPAAVPAAATKPEDLVSLVLAALDARNAQAAPLSNAAPAPRPASATPVESIDDVGIRSMATALRSMGKDLDVDRVLGKALQYNDPSLIDSAYLREQGGQNAEQLQTVASSIVHAVAARAAAIERDVHTLAGGEAQWNTAVALFNSKAPEALRITVTQMLNSTNEKSIRAGAQLVADFSQGSPALPRPGSAQFQVAAGPAGAAALSKAQFQAELFKLKPGTPGYEEARNDLFARRQMGRNQGIK